jgi:hypothetical protein
VSDERPILPEQTGDDTDESEPAQPDSLERLLRERPPHHDRDG